MRLSEAIRLGAMMRPQAFRTLFTIDEACALGAALLAVGAAQEQALRSVRKRWPWALTVSANCPSCGRSCPVFGVITHLNDDHRWTREKIGTWIAEIEPEDALPLRDALDEAAWRDDKDWETKRGQKGLAALVGRWVGRPRPAIPPSLLLRGDQVIE